jgi:hypothetical protein
MSGRARPSTLVTVRPRLTLLRRDWEVFCRVAAEARQTPGVVLVSLIGVFHELRAARVADALPLTRGGGPVNTSD